MRFGTLKSEVNLFRTCQADIKPGTALPPLTSSKSDGEQLHPGIEKLDLNLPLGDGPPLAYQLVEPLLGHLPVSLFVDVHPVSRARCRSVDQQPEPHRS